MKDKSIIKVVLILVLPVFIASSITLVSGYWKHSTKNDSAVVTQNLYSVEFYTNNNPATPSFTYDGLEYDSCVELPMNIDNYGSHLFLGWSTTISGSLLETDYIRYSDYISNAAITVLKLYAQYS